MSAACRRVAGLLTLTALCLAPFVTRGGGFHNADFGVRRMGMFAVVGRPDDVTAIFHNPAGLVLGKGTRLYHSQSWFFNNTRIRFYDSQGALRPEHEIAPDWSIGAIPFLGVASDLGTERLRLGLAVFSPNAYGAVLPDDEPTRYYATRVLFLGSRAAAAAAYKFSDRFAMAAGISVFHLYLTATRFLSPLVLQDADHIFDDPDDSASTDAKLELDGQDFSLAWDLAFLFTPLDTLRLGIAFSSGTEVNLEGDVKLTYATGSVERTTHHTNFVIPFTLRAGFNWEFAPDFELGMDIRYYHYQVFQEQRTVLKEPIMSLDGFRDPKNYGNSVNWCIGMMYHLTPKLQFMVGYQEDQTPIPSQTYSLDNPTRDQRGVALGLRWQAFRNHRFGVAFVQNWFDIADIQDSIGTPPSNVKGHGANTELGIDYEWQL